MIMDFITDGSRGLKITFNHFKHLVLALFHFSAQSLPFLCQMHLRGWLRHWTRRHRDPDFVRGCCQR